MLTFAYRPNSEACYSAGLSIIIIVFTSQLSLLFVTHSSKATVPEIPSEDGQFLKVTEVTEEHNHKISKVSGV